MNCRLHLGTPKGPQKVNLPGDRWCRAEDLRAALLTQPGLHHDPDGLRKARASRTGGRALTTPASLSLPSQPFSPPMLTFEGGAGGGGTTPLPPGRTPSPRHLLPPLPPPPMAAGPAPSPPPRSGGGAGRAAAIGGRRLTDGRGWAGGEEEEEENCVILQCRGHQRSWGRPSLHRSSEPCGAFRFYFIFS